MAYGKSKHLAKRTQSEKVLRDKAFKIASDPKYDSYQRGLASMVYKFFDKQISGAAIKAEPNYQTINFIGRLLENLREEKFIHLSEAMLGALI